MKLHIYNIITLFTFLIIITCASAMEQNNNELHPLLCLPPEIQQQIVFPQYTQTTKITWSKLDELEDVVNIFFIFNVVCKQFNQHLKLPWKDLALEQKNRMLQEIMGYALSSSPSPCRIMPLAFVYSGANVDTRAKVLCHPTVLHWAICQKDESAVVMLLNHKADPYQLDEQGTPICFYASTVAIAQLFVKKIDDKDALLSRYNGFCDLLTSRYSPEVVIFWFDYGVNPRHIYSGTNNDCLLHRLVRSLGWCGNTKENIRVKSELLLQRIADMINTINAFGETPLDMLINCYCIVPGGYNVLIGSFRKHGAKTAQELEEENKQLITQQEDYETTYM